MTLRAFLLPALVFAAGCQVPPSTFEVEVQNLTPVPISAGLLKEGGAVEPGWTAPEQIAIRAPQLADRHWGTVIEPGQTQILGPHSGRFPQGSLAVLRIYAGDLSIDEMIAHGRRNPNREDVYLWPGRSSYVVATRQGRLIARRTDTAAGAELIDARGNR